MEAILLTKYRGKLALVTNDTEVRGTYILMLNGGEECPARWALDEVTPHDKAEVIKALSNMVCSHGDLLAACEKLLRAVCFGDHDNIKDRAHIHLAATSPEIRAIRAAIAKAKANT